MALLWTKSTKNVPQGYNELILCRDVYHCLPSQLAQEDWGVIQEHIRYMNVEGEVREMEKRKPIKAKEPGMPESK